MRWLDDRARPHYLLATPQSPSSTSRVLRCGRRIGSRSGTRSGITCVYSKPSLVSPGCPNDIPYSSINSKLPISIKFDERTKLSHTGLLQHVARNARVPLRVVGLHRIRHDVGKGVNLLPWVLYLDDSCDRTMVSRWQSCDILIHQCSVTHRRPLTRRPHKPHVAPEQQLVLTVVEQGVSKWVVFSCNSHKPRSKPNII